MNSRKASLGLLKPAQVSSRNNYRIARLSSWAANSYPMPAVPPVIKTVLPESFICDSTLHFFFIPRIELRVKESVGRKKPMATVRQWRE